MTTFVEQLIARLALDTDEQSFKKGEQGMDDLASSAVKMGAVIGASIAAVQGALTSMVVSFASEADATNKLARRIGTTAEVIQEFDHVAGRAGVSIGLMRNSLEKLNGKASQAAAGSAEMKATFDELGISAAAFAASSPDEKFNQIAAAMEKLPTDADRTRVAMKLFEEEGRSMVTVFENGAKGISRMRQEARDLGLFSTEDASAAEEFNDRLLDAGRAMKAVRNAVGAALIPALTGALQIFVKFFKQNRELISSSLVSFFKAAAVALKGLAYAAGLFAAFKLGQIVLATASAVSMLTKAFTAGRLAALLFNGAVLLIPILIGLAIAAVALLAEDMYTFFEGGDSMVGGFVKKWPLLGEVIYGVAGALKEAWGFAGDLFGILYSIVTLDFGMLLDSFQSLGNRIIGVFRSVGQAISDSLPSWATGALGSAFGAAESAGGFISNQVSNAGALISSVPAMAQSAVSSVTSSMQDNRQYFITGTDIGEVKRVINEKNAFAAKTIDTGVEY